MIAVSTVLLYILHFKSEKGSSVIYTLVGKWGGNAAVVSVESSDASVRGCSLQGISEDPSRNSFNLILDQ